ncbi:MAG: hypothetical protein Q4D90_01020 [bacterium]|nr:hypothetical protein [bacterium]
MGNPSEKASLSYVEARTQYLESLRDIQKSKAEREEAKKNLENSQKREQYAEEAMLYFEENKSTWESNKITVMDVREEQTRKLQEKLDALFGRTVEVSIEEFNLGMMPESLNDIIKAVAENTIIQSGLQKRLQQIFGNEVRKHPEAKAKLQPEADAQELANGILYLADLYNVNKAEAALDIKRKRGLSFDKLKKLEPVEQEQVTKIIDRLIGENHEPNKPVQSLSDYDYERHQEIDKSTGFLWNRKKKTREVEEEKRRLEEKKAFIKRIVQEAKERGEEYKRTLEAGLKRTDLLKIIEEENKSKKSQVKEIEMVEQKIAESVPGEARNKKVDKELEENNPWKNEEEETKKEFKTASRKRFFYELALDMTEGMVDTLKKGIVVITDGVIQAPLQELQQKIAQEEQALEQKKRDIAAGSNVKTVNTVVLTEIVKEHDTQIESIGKMKEEARRLEKVEKERIEENHKRLHYGVVEAMPPVERRKGSEEIISEIQGKVSEGNLAAQNVCKNDAQKRNDDLQATIDDVEKELQQEADYRELQSCIQEVSKVFTDHSLNNLETAITVCQKVYRLANKIMGRGGDSEQQEEQSEFQGLEAPLNAVKTALQSKEPQNRDELRNSILEIGELLDNKLSELHDNVKSNTLRIQRECAALENNFIGLKERETEFSEWRKGKEEDTATLMIQFTKEQTEKWSDDFDNVIEAQEKGIQAAKDMHTEEQKNIADATKKLESFTDKDQELSEKEDQLHHAFAQTVKQNIGEKKTYRTLSKEDVFAEEGPEDFSFLSKLTKVNMSAGMNLDKAMEAFRKIHINGVNAVMYFNLEERYQKAMVDETEANKLIRGLPDYGSKIKEALQATFEKPSQKPTGYVAGLVGQSIAVENDSLLLSAVKLKHEVLSKDEVAALKGQEREDYDRISSFNRYTGMITSSMNEIREVVAESELKGREKQTVRDKAYSQAVYRSRNIFAKTNVEKAGMSK